LAGFCDSNFTFVAFVFPRAHSRRRLRAGGRAALGHGDPVTPMARAHPLPPIRRGPKIYRTQKLRGGRFLRPIRPTLFQADRRTIFWTDLCFLVRRRVSRLNERPGPLMPSEPGRLDRCWSRRHMTQLPDNIEKHSGATRLPAALAGFCCDEGNCPECLWAYRKGLAFMRQKRAARRKLRQSSPDGLKTAAQAASKLNCSIKTLNGHVAAGALHYVDIGHGRKRRRIRFTDADLDEFVANQTRKDVPCPSTKTRARRTGNLTSGGDVIAFTGVPKPGHSGTQKK